MGFEIRDDFHEPQLFKDDAKSVVLGFVAWTMLYIIMKQLPLDKIFPESMRPKRKEDDLDLRNRFVSLVHGLALFFLSGYHYMFIPSECGDFNSVYQRKMMCFTLSYFLYDFVIMLFEGLLDRSMLVHHSLCMLLIYVALYENLGGNIALSTFFAAEISNPSMHTKHMLRIVGMRYTKAYEFAELSFLILYIYGRMYLGNRICF